ncbi:MAG: hypothetical protein AAB513_01520 [Patescibacteria group bacterium]
MYKLKSLLEKEPSMEESWRHKKAPGIKTRISAHLEQFVTKLLPPRKSHVELLKELNPEVRERLYPLRYQAPKKKT